MSTVAYIRVSTARQADSGLGLEAQTSRIQQFSQLNNIEITETIVDAGISGRTMNRDGLQQLLSGVAEGRFTRLIVSSADRLTRSCRDLQALLHGPLRDVEVMCAHMVTSLTSDVEFAEQEAEEYRRRTSEALQAKKARGEKLGAAPFGQRWEDGRLVDDEREQKIISIVREMRSRGLTLQAIKDELAQMGMTGRRGVSFSFSTLAKVSVGVEVARAIVDKQPKPTRGKAQGKAPFGQRWEDGRLVDDEREQKIISIVREMRSRGLTLQAIKDELAQMGMTGRTGASFGFSTLAKIGGR